MHSSSVSTGETQSPLQDASLLLDTTGPKGRDGVNEKQLLSQAKPESGASILGGDGSAVKNETEKPSSLVKSNEPLQETAGATTNQEPEPLQEIKITRVPPEMWRKVKKERKVDTTKSVLLVSSKGSSSLLLQKTRQKHTESKSKSEVSEEKSDAPNHIYAPYRLAVNSTYLLSVLEKYTGILFTEEQNVLVRPFKYLVEIEQDIREAFHTSRVACEQASNELAQSVQEAETRGAQAEERVETQTEGKGPEKFKEAVIRMTRERDELGCLVEFMDVDMRDIFSVRRQIQTQSVDKIAFEHLWQFFKPGDLVYSCPENDEIRRQAYRILHVTGGRVCFDTTRRSSFDPINDRQWESDSENDEKCCDAVRCSGTETTSFIIDCFYLDSDGTALAPRGKRFVVTPYSAERLVSLLPLQHLFLDPKHQQIKNDLIKRGARFLQLAPRTHLLYHGTTLNESNKVQSSYNNFEIQAAEVHGEVIIDQGSGVQHFREQFYKWSLKTSGRIVQTPTKTDKREILDYFPKKSDGDWVTDVFDDSIFEENRRQEFMGTTELGIRRIINNISISDDERILLPPRLYGYSLLDHRWASFYINILKEISMERAQEGWSKLEDLVLPDQHKTILMALITNQVRLPSYTTSNDSEPTRDQFSMDVVSAKGKGLIILLHGAPGVGKTSTAECIAAKLKRPLLPITCGDIGTSAQEAERNLDSFCTLAHRWRCVLLLDEADVFLAKRERGDIKRNSLVSVFLRVLEYFSGVIILTTNRVGEFDEAFRSRIHICLYYPKLEQDQTKEIWDMNIQRIKKSNLEIDIDERKIKRYVDEHWKKNAKRPTRRWNGRQIKNAFQTAIALANWDFFEEGNTSGLERPRITVDHFRHVAKITAHFDDYISDIHGAPEEDAYGTLAERDGLRKDARPTSNYRNQGNMHRRREAEPRAFRRDASYDSSVNQDEDYSQDDSGPEAMRDGDFDAGYDSDEIKQLELQVKLAKLKKGRRNKTTTPWQRGRDEEDRISR
ncbi:uncharacterized protein N7511_001276 [Penicillium nucicola]|uniref:uncharacterized protein n=1 Tax=Penicillium nucicola TaxID=1850975 RepID=UPI0025450B85|nr:uncharacterized protein N7511_001276 [Penicillium nucicola]KAJ5776265.1 hypothetical protein N7511_001276 [Penicillium nucicola]